MRKETLMTLLLSLCSLGLWAQRDSILLGGVEVLGVASGNNVQSTMPRQVVSRDDMVQMGIFTIEDALKHVSGVTVRDYGGAGGMKTVSVRGIGAKHTAVVYDGVALSDCQTGEIDLSRYSLANMRSLMLTVGDGDNIFVPARNIASASVLEMSTDISTGMVQGRDLRVGLSAGAWGTVEPSLFWRTPLGNRLTLSMQGNYIYTEGNYPFTLTNVDLVTREHRQNSRMSSGHGELNLAWHPAQGQAVSLKAYYYDNAHRLPGIVHLYTQDNDERLHDRNAFGQASYLGQLSQRLSLKAAAKVNWVATRYHVGIPSGGVKSESYWQREYYATTAWLYTPTQWLSVDYSLDYALNNLNSTLTTPTATVGGAVSVRPCRHSILQALSAKVQQGRLTAVARLLRSDYLNGVAEGEASADAHRWSPSVSLSWRLLPRRQLFVRAFWKSIFRVPTFNELYYYHIGSTTLKPENTSQWNLGLTGELPSSKVSVRFSADGYVSRVSDKIVAIPFNMFVWRTMNVARVDVTGADLTLGITGHLDRRQQLELTGNYSLQRVRNHTRRESPNYGNQIAYVPEHTFSTSLIWLNPWVGVAFTTDGMSNRWATNEHADGTRIAGFVELGLSVFRTLRLWQWDLTLRAGVQNLLDRQYDIVAHYPMPGRGWKVSAIFELR